MHLSSSSQTFARLIHRLRGYTSTKVATRFDSRPDNGFPDYDRLIADMPLKHDQWHFPSELAKDLPDVELPWSTIEEVFACAWEYTRCIIPQYTNWDRYIAFVRTIVIAIIAEFRGSLVDITAGDRVLSYDLNAILDALFQGTPGW